MLQELPGLRSLEDAKAWMLDKLAARVHPMGLTDVSATREVIASLRGLDGQNWASAWISRGDEYVAEATAAQNSGDTEQARDAWYQAYAFYFLGRFPCPNHPEKQRSYEKALAAYRAFGELATPPIEFVSVPFLGRAGEGQSIPFLCAHAGGAGTPASDRDVGRSGCLEGRDDDPHGGIAKQGFATIALDNVGTGQSPIKAGPDGERQFLPVLDWIERSSRFDPSRIAIVGRSFGGHWATKLAHLYPDGSVPRSTGVVACIICSSPIGSRTPATRTAI